MNFIVNKKTKTKININQSNDDMSATIEEKIGSDGRRGEEKKSLNFEEEMETLCKRLQLTHGH